MSKACENVTNPICSAAGAPSLGASRAASGAWVQALHHANRDKGRRTWGQRDWRTAASAWYGERRERGPQRRAGHV